MATSTAIKKGMNNQITRWSTTAKGDRRYFRGDDRLCAGKVIGKDFSDAVEDAGRGVGGLDTSVAIGKCIWDVAGEITGDFRMAAGGEAGRDVGGDGGKDVGKGIWDADRELVMDT